MDSAEVTVSAPSPTVENAVTVAYGVVDYESSLYSFSYGTVSIADYLWIAPGVELGLGARLGFGERLKGGACGEGFGSVALVPHFGTIFDSNGRSASWRPSLGIEAGVTSVKVQFKTRAPSSGFDVDSPPGTIYAQIFARPARFRFTHFNASVVGLGFGTPLGAAGQKLRVQIELVQLGLVL